MSELVLAKVNGKEIKQKDVEFFLNVLGPERAAQFDTPEGKKQLLQEIVNQELLYFQAKESKLEETEEFKDELERLKGHILKTLAIKQLFGTIEIKDEDMVKYYEENKQKFMKPEQIQASHILVKTEEVGKEALDKLNSGEKFEEVAKEVSECPSKDQGGNLGLFGRGQMVPEFEEVAFKLKIDEVSELVKTQFGFHIIKLTDKKDKVISSFEEIKQNIKYELYSIKQAQIYQDEISKLKNKYDVEIYE